MVYYFIPNAEPTIWGSFSPPISAESSGIAVLLGHLQQCQRVPGGQHVAPARFLFKVPVAAG